MDLMFVEIKQSNINKSGVFATRNFKAGEVVLKWDTSKRFDNTEIATDSNSIDGHIHPYDEKTSFLVQSPECFVNHSCENNTEVHDFSDIAIRDIQAGEEITSNYETDGAGLSFICNCGAAECRKSIGFIKNERHS